MICDNSIYAHPIVIDEDLVHALSAIEGFDFLHNYNGIVLAGFTGAGKTTALQYLAEKYTSWLLLPDRRELTEKCIITPLQSINNLEQKVLSRNERYEYVQSYKKVFPEGMGGILKNIHLNKACNGFLFDGVRGENEIKAVLESFPKVKVILLEATDEIRHQRIQNRGESYDGPKEQLQKVVLNDKKTHGEVTQNLEHDRLFRLDTSNLSIMETRQAIDALIK